MTQIIYCISILPPEVRALVSGEYIASDAAGGSANKPLHIARKLYV
jgi:hypothetical protein